MPKPSKGGKPKAAAKAPAVSAKPGAAARAAKMQRSNGKSKGK